MKKQLLFLASFILASTILFAQAKPKIPVKKNLTDIERKVSEMGFPYEKISDSIVVIPFGGSHIASYKVRFAQVSDLYIIYINLTEAIPDKLDETKYKYLLEQNNDLDFVKVGLDKSNNKFYMRIDVLSAASNTASLKSLINQIANAADQIAGDL
ncbi:hypothetical protein GALL_108550 [mine drainage metagenome]|uniref:Sensory transduction regulator n=1 Tax=mine drainage metagenome TaxID=410659 RepID=A0A1J5SSF4_9ZZZZ